MVANSANSISLTSSDADKAAASSSIAGNVATAASVIQAATAQAPSTTAADDSTNDIGTVLANIVASLNGPADSLVSSLGVGEYLPFCRPSHEAD